jgi:hypothetical protein
MKSPNESNFEGHPTLLLRNKGGASSEKKWSLPVVVQQRRHLVAFKFLAAIEEVEFHHKT